MINRNVLLTIASRLAIVIFGFASSIITARFLGPAGRGDYFLVITFVIMITQFGNLGLQSSNTYLVARDRNLLGKLTTNSFWVSLVVGAGSSAFIIFAMRLTNLLSVESATLFYFAILLAPTMIFYMLATNLLVGIGELVAFNVFQIVSNLTVLVALSIAAWNGAGTFGFLTASLVGWFLIAITLLALLKQRANGKLIFHFDVFKSGFTYATKAYLTCLFGFLVLRANIFFLKHFSDSQEIGYFSVATQIIDVLGILPQSAALVLFPDLVRNQAGSWKKTMKNLESVGWFMFVTCLVAGILVTPFVTIAFGKVFLPAVPMLLCLLPGSFFLGLITIVSQHLAASGFPRILVVLWAAAFITVSLLSVVLIPTYSGKGAAIAVSSTYCVLFILIYFIAKKNQFKEVANNEQGEYQA